MTDSDERRRRLTCAHDRPISHALEDDDGFGLQAAQQEIIRGERRADGALKKLPWGVVWVSELR